MKALLIAVVLAVIAAVPIPASEPVRAFAHQGTTSDPADDADPGEYTETIGAGETAIWFWQTDDDAATTDSISPSQAFENNSTVTFAGTYQLHVRAICASTGGSTTLTTDDPGTGQVANFMGVSRYTGLLASGCLTEALTNISGVNVSGGSVDNVTCSGACMRWGALMTNRNPTATSGTVRHEDTNVGLGLTYNIQDQAGTAGDANLTWTFDTDGVFTAAGLSFEEDGGGSSTANPKINTPVKGGGFNLLTRLLESRYSHPFGPRHLSTKIFSRVTR
jgi:hypothetical protein